ncbi:MAG: hypothetical protein D3923_04910, partial [Candidatus Electrothrix sp. AR3]|nr:hypothetical protein [Candidatus Electrothrix sp. AR3]
MNIFSKNFSFYIIIFIFSLLFSTEAFSKTEFYLFPNDVKQKVNCDLLEIKNSQALCTASNLLITYDLAKRIKIEVVTEGISMHFKSITQETRMK